MRRKIVRRKREVKWWRGRRVGEEITKRNVGSVTERQQTRI